MARISGVDLPRDKRIEIGLTYVYGIGRATSNRLLKEAGVNPDTRVRDLTDEEVGKIRDAIDADSILIEGDLRREIAINIRDYRKLVATEASVTEKVFQFVVRRQRQTQELVRVLRRQ